MMVLVGNVANVVTAASDSSSHSVSLVWLQSVAAFSHYCYYYFFNAHWLDERLLYLAVFLSDATVAALPACTAFCDT